MSEQEPRPGERIVVTSDNGKGALEYELRGSRVIMHSITAGPWMLADEGEQEPRPDESVREMSFRLSRWDRNRMSQLVAKRRERGMTQADVAKRMGATKRWVRKFERYDSDPRASEIRMYTVAVYAPLLPGENNASR